MILVWYSMRMMWYDRVENIRDWFVLDYYSVLQLIYQSWSSDDCYLNYQVSPFIILCPLPPVFTYNCEECSQAAPSGAGTKDSPALILIRIAFPLNIGECCDGLSTVVINQLIKFFLSISSLRPRTRSWLYFWWQQWQEQPSPKFCERNSARG